MLQSQAQCLRRDVSGNCTVICKPRSHSTSRLTAKIGETGRAYLVGSIRSLSNQNEHKLDQQWCQGHLRSCDIQARITLCPGLSRGNLEPLLEFIGLGLHAQVGQQATGHANHIHLSLLRSRGTIAQYDQILVHLRPRLLFGQSS